MTAVPRIWFACAAIAGFGLLLTPAAAEAGDCVPITNADELVAMGFDPGTEVCMAENATAEAVPVTDAEPIASDQFSSISAKEFIGRIDTTGTSWRYAGGPRCCVDLSRVGTERFADAQFERLHEGLNIKSISFWAHDANAADLALFVFQVCQPAFGAGAPSIVTIASLSTTGATGDQVKSLTFAPGTRPVNNRDCTYLARARFDAAATTLALQKVRMDFEGGGTNTIVHQRTVRRFTSAASNLTDAEADAIMGTGANGASGILQTNNGAGDVACDVAMVRQGGVTVFSDGDGSIDSAAELTAVFGLPGNIKVVNAINFCGGPGANIIGCAPVPGNTLIVVRFTANLEGILWAHEFGHNKGLSHVSNVTRIMNPFITNTARGVTAAECGNYRVPSPATTGAEVAVAEASGVGVVSDATANGDLVDVTVFVQRMYAQGLPFAQASRYDSSAVPTLLAILDDPAQMSSWANAAATLGAIGDERAVTPLIAFIKAADGDDEPLAREHYVAKTSAMLGLGWLVNATDNQEALDFLVASLDPGMWAGSDVGVAQWQTSTTERDQAFSTQAVWALAVSGSSRAEAALEAMQRTGRSRAQRAFQAQAGDLFSEALDVSEQVNADGLAGYYDAAAHQ